MTRGLRVLIVGAGLTGLALARALHARGCVVELVERRPRGEAGGAGILLTGNAVRALHGLGLDREVIAASLRVSALRFTDERERELFRVDLAARPDWPPFVSIAREALQRVLLEAASPLVPRFGVAPVSIAQQDGGVEVAFDDGSRGAYALLVGADGVHSWTRQRLFGAESVQPIAGYHGWRFVAPCPGRLREPQYMIGNGRTLLLHALPGGQVYCGAGPVHLGARDAGGDDGEEEDGGELERLRSAFSEFGGAAREVLDGVTASTRLIPTRYYHLEQRPWSNGRCVLIGDAAHACAPTLAQGGAMAFEDAFVLAELLSRADEIGVEAALAAFELRRSARVAQVQRASLARMHANHPLEPHALAVRNAVFGTVGAAQLVAAWAPLMQGFD